MYNKSCYSQAVLMDKISDKFTQLEVIVVPFPLSHIPSQNCYIFQE